MKASTWSRPRLVGRELPPAVLLGATGPRAHETSQYIVGWGGWGTHCQGVGRTTSGGVHGVLGFTAEASSEHSAVR